MKLMAIDGNSIINRAFYGVRHLSAADGTPTNAVYGFLSTLEKLISDESPDALCVMFDTPSPTFRHERYEGYKAKRTGMPDELAVQMPILKETLDAMNIARYELPGWEADDLLGTLAKKCENIGWECVIVTGDKDSLQLVTDLTRIKLVKTQKGQSVTIDYTPTSFFDEYGFSSEKIVDLKALMGDNSDNIPGVAGVGEKTAMELVRNFGNVEAIYSALAELDIKDSVRNKLEAGRDDAKMSFELAEIHNDAPIDFAPQDNIRAEYKNDELFNIFKRLGFIRMIDKFNLKPPVGKTSSFSEVKSPEITELTSAQECDKLAEIAKSAEYVAMRIDFEYFDTVAVAVGGGQDVYLLQRSKLSDFDNILGELLSGKVKKVGHNVKDILRNCLDRAIETDGWIFDTALAAYLLSPTDSGYAIARISERYCGYTPESDSSQGGQMSFIEDSDNGKSIANEAYAIGLLKDVLIEKLKESELEKLFYDIEFPLCQVLAEMEHVGFLVDKEALVEFGETLAVGLAETEQQIYELAGEVFNINSPKQLGMILFEKLMLPAPKKTKTGWSTNIEVLDHLTNKHPIIGLVKHFRELSKLKSTYTDGLLKVIAPDGRIHTHFQMTVTATGRLSSTEPNMQNIPVRKQIGEELRKMFIAEAGKVLVDADYSQIELRLLAHIAGDPVMQKAFEQNEDIHTVTASQVFDTPIEEITSAERGKAKAVNFGIVYGISAFSLAQDIGVTPFEAKQYIENYLRKYSGVRKYMANIVESAKKLGYVSTIFGRWRYLPELKSSNHNTRSFGERVALNMPIQGTAADIIKIAMINVSKRLKSENLSARLILQVHDELIVECPTAEAEHVSIILREEMESAASLSVPLVAETRSGKSWHDAK